VFLPNAYAHALTLGSVAVEIKKLGEKGARTEFLGQNEIDRLLKKASDDLRPILVMALHTGMRRGEIFNLQWRDVDLANRVITVRESKSGKKRTIPIDETLYSILRGLPSRFTKGLVFPAPKSPKDGKQKVRHDVKREFNDAVAKAEIKNFRFHDLRHTFASHLVMRSMPSQPRIIERGPIKTLDTANQTDTVGNSGNGQSL